MGNSVLLNVAQYYPQNDSETAEGYRMCWSSTCAMALKFLKPTALMGVNGDDTYLRASKKYGDTTFPQTHIRTLRDYGIQAVHQKNGTRAKIISEIDAGFPIALAILHRGHVSRPGGGGHWLLGVGYTPSHIIVHDPNGELDNVNGGYINHTGGKFVRYTWKNFLRRWHPEGTGHGHLMTFRPIAAIPPVRNVLPDPAPGPTEDFPNTWEGVVAAAKAAGARHPETVAAQWALESGWGKKPSGTHNYFGQKAPGGTVKTTKEFVNGKKVTIQDSFKNFHSLYDSVEYLVDRWYKDFGTHKGVNRAANATEAARLLVSEGYATDPAYATKLSRIITQQNQRST